MTVTQITLTSILVPTIFELYISLQEKNINVVIECMAHLAGVIIAMAKIFNIHNNRENFKKLFDLVAKKWEELELTNELYILEKMTARGSMLAHLYRSLNFLFAVIFLTIPLVFPILDIVLPLNETRVRLQIFKINYLIINNDDYFYVEYLHLTLATCIFSLSILGTDSLYIIIIHHSSSLFALTGYQIKKALDSSSIEHDPFSDKNVYDQVKRSAITYNEALQFFDILRETSENLYFIQISLIVVGISVTAYQTVINLSHPENVIRSALFFMSDQIILFVTSACGQLLQNHSSELENQILSPRHLAFQKNGGQDYDIYNIPYYRMLKTYLQFLGQDPHQKSGLRNIIVVVVVISMAGVLIPTTLELYASLCRKDMDAIIECMPHFIASAISTVKILNLHFHRESFNNIFQFMAKEWEQLKEKNELHVLEATVIEGNKMAHLYRKTLLSFMVLFLLVPLISPTMDIILPLNETRPRQQLLRVNYIFFNDEYHFFFVYLQLAWGSIIVVLTVVAADSLLILIIHHNSGLFAVCGYQVQKATKDLNIFDSSATSESYMYDQFKHCVIMHNEAIQFYDILNECSRISYLIQVGLTMIGTSVTAVQTVTNLDRPEEALRSAVFCGANQFHLFVLSLPGQVLLDHCTQLSDTIYTSRWYRMSVRVQKMIYVIQIRSKKPCTLTAGGLYEMNMENFGITFKTCMSYFTMLLSLK
ncbi:PREDICTED: uncharacterized protein LOC108546972 [Eufriesea mexicana]|uniref:uncharacterized protein LOC108546972 n=1 Tax=Eufriesea mexicana TaxID=516756 RepID=UPI00083BE04E|nr:PREDICTED: uncharacterized protein LOC108546972 [Eufriesea mexicana]